MDNAVLNKYNEMIEQGEELDTAFAHALYTREEQVSHILQAEIRHHLLLKGRLGRAILRIQDIIRATPKFATIDEIDADQANDIIDNIVIIDLMIHNMKRDRQLTE